MACAVGFYLAFQIAAFMNDLANQGLSDRVLVMTQSEFGRRVNENGSLGTDHGTAAPMFFVGDPVVGGDKVTGKLLDEIRGDKIKVFKKKRRKGYKRLRGHRQELMRVEIQKIQA